MQVTPLGSALLPQFGGLFLDEPHPDSTGYIRLPERPGFGLTVNSQVRLLRPYSRVPASFEAIEAIKDARTPAQRRWLHSAEALPLGVPDAAVGGGGAPLPPLSSSARSSRPHKAGQ
jgi:hypothetical protein